nr:uncharacterized protein LOC128694505 [Cherax quadricarinatus]XP_053640634.1 uncharacterized protein LOC128694505 [Cherax quadricarinatus]
MALNSRRRINTICIELIRGAVTGSSMDLLLPAIIRDTYGIANEEICGVALNGTTRIFVKLTSASVHEAVIDKYQETTIAVNYAVSVRLHDVSRYYTWVKIRNVPSEADDSDIRSDHMTTAGRWAAGPYTGIPEGTYSVKMTLRLPIPSYVVLSDFRNEVFVTYAGQRRTCRLCGSYDHVAAQCGKRRGYPEQQRRQAAEEDGEKRELPYATLPKQGLSWSEEVDKAVATETAGLSRGEVSPSLDVNQVCDENIPDLCDGDVEVSLAEALDALIDDKIIRQVGDPDLTMGSVADDGVGGEGRLQQSEANVLMVQDVEVEVHQEEVKDATVQEEGMSRKRMTALSDSDDLLMPAQRPGKKSWAEVMRRGTSGPKEQGFAKVVSKGGEG